MSTTCPTIAAPGYFRATCIRMEVSRECVRMSKSTPRYEIRWTPDEIRRDVTHNVCDETFTDRAAYITHMRDCHGVKAKATAQTTFTYRAPKAPVAVKPRNGAWDPKPLDPGAWVTFWQNGEERTGQVSDESPNGYWVIPANRREGDPAAFDVSRPTSLGHTVPDGLFDLDESKPADALIPDGPGRVFPDLTAVRSHWRATAAVASESARRCIDYPGLAIQRDKDMILSDTGCLIAVRRNGRGGWMILHTGSAKVVVQSRDVKLRTVADVRASLARLEAIGVPWGDSADAVTAALRETFGAYGTVAPLRQIADGSWLGESIRYVAPVAAVEPAPVADMVPVEPIAETADAHAEIPAPVIVESAGPIVAVVETYLRRVHDVSHVESDGTVRAACGWGIMLPDGPQRRGATVGVRFDRGESFGIDDRMCPACLAYVQSAAAHQNDTMPEPVSEDTYPETYRAEYARLRAHGASVADAADDAGRMAARAEVARLNALRAEAAPLTGSVCAAHGPCRGCGALTTRTDESGHACGSSDCRTRAPFMPEPVAACPNSGDGTAPADHDGSVYRVIGTTDDVTVCGACGREDLQRTVVLSTGAGELYAGSDCAARLTGQPVAQVDRDARAGDRARVVAEDATRRAQSADDRAAFLGWVADTYGVRVAQPSDLWDAVEGMTPFTLRQAWRASTSPILARAG